MLLKSKLRITVLIYEYGIRLNVLNWIHAFLGDRSQQIVVAGEESDSVTVTSWVPRGSVLELILFLVDINDLHYNITIPGATICRLHGFVSHLGGHGWQFRSSKGSGLTFCVGDRLGHEV